MSLIKRLFLVSELHMNYAKMASAADFRSPRSSDQRRFWQASGHHPCTSDQATGYSCDQHRTCVRCTLCRCDKQPLTQQTERFSLSLLYFPTRGKRAVALSSVFACRSEKACSARMFSVDRTRSLPASLGH